MAVYRCMGCGEYFPTELLLVEHGGEVLRDPVRLAEHKAASEVDFP